MCIRTLCRECIGPVSSGTARKSPAANTVLQLCVQVVPFFSLTEDPSRRINAESKFWNFWNLDLRTAVSSRSDVYSYSKWMGGLGDLVTITMDASPGTRFGFLSHSPGMIPVGEVVYQSLHPLQPPAGPIGVIRTVLEYQSPPMGFYQFSYSCA